MQVAAIRNCFSVASLVAIFALAVLSSAIAGCGKQESTSLAASPTSAARPTDAPQATVDPSTTGTITGTVTLAGPPPKPRLIYMTSEPTCDRQHNGPVVSPEVIVDENGALANVVVFIKSGLGNYKFAAPVDPLKLSQKGCMYDPHVVALMVGQTLRVTNDDQTLHNVHAMSKINPAWNRGQAGGQPPLEMVFSQPELAIPIQCNIHPWMRSYAFVFANSYFDVTPKSGKFELKNLPPGTYTIEAWQEKFGAVDQTVTLAEKESKAVSFSFKSVAAPAP